MCWRIFCRCERVRRGQAWFGGSARRGQATVEAALLIPLLLAGILVIAQPCILLYDRLVMVNAAAEGCRVAMTLAADSAKSDASAYVMRRLGSVPPMDWFHVHGDGDKDCSWSIEVEGDESTAEVQVTITNQVALLPVVGVFADLLDISEKGKYTFSVEISESVQPDWVQRALAGSSPAGWVGAWNND